jgi:hypothetical protein
MSDAQAKDRRAPLSAHSHKEAAKQGYVRARDLPKLLPLWPSDVGAVSLSDHARLLAKLRRALRRERQRGLGGHWSYDLARHAQLLRAYRAETGAYLRAMEAYRRRIAV